MRLSARSIARKTLQNMLYEELLIVLRLNPRPKVRVPTLKTIRELSKELADRLLENPKFLETVGLIGKMQITNGFQQRKPRSLSNPVGP